MAERKRPIRNNRTDGGDDVAPEGDAPVAAGSDRGAGISGGRSAEAPAPEGARPASAAPPFARINWVLSIVGVVALVAGFLILSQANAQADNLPARLGPPLILGAYLLIFVAIILRAPSARSGGGAGERDGE